MVLEEGQAILLLQAMIKLERPEYALLFIPTVLAYILFLIFAERNYSKLLKILIPAGRKRWIRKLIIFSKIFLILLLTFSLCQPYIEKREVKPLEKGDLEAMREKKAALILLVDVSKSMSYEDRIGKTESFLLSFLSQLGNLDEVVVAVFAKDVEVVYKGPPSNFSLSLHAGRRYSAIGDALSFAFSYAKASGLPAGVVLVTDGGWNYGSNPVHIAKLYGKIPLAVVHVGYGASSDPELLMEVAEAAGGWYYEINEVTLEVLESLSENLYSEVKYAALTSSGESHVEYVVKDDSSPQAFIWAVFALFLIISLADGV